MRGDQLVGTQLLMAQAVSAMGERIASATGLGTTPVPFAMLPATPVKGMIATVTNSNTNAWGATVTPGGFFSVLAWYNGSAWTVIGK